MEINDETGYPIGLGDTVIITKPMHHRQPSRDLGGRKATVVGLDTIDWRTGEPRGDGIVYLRIEDDAAVCHIPSGRVRVLKKTKK